MTLRQWGLPDKEGLSLRVIVVREPRIGEPDGTNYVVSGEGHGESGESVHASLADAQTAAEASLTASQLAGIPDR